MERKRDGFVRGMVTGVVLAAGIVLVGAGRGHTQDKIIGFAATDEKLFRVWESGRIEFLGVDLDTGSPAGVPDWSPVKIDSTMVWDSRGKNFYKKK